MPPSLSLSQDSFHRFTFSSFWARSIELIVPRVEWRFLTIFAILFSQNRNKFKVSLADDKVCLTERKSFLALSKAWPQLSWSSFSSRSLPLYILAHERIGWGNKVSWGWSNSAVEVNIRLSNILLAISSREDWQTWTPSNFELCRRIW